METQISFAFGSIEWRKVPGWPRYSVSDTGDVRNDETGLLLKPWRLKNGRWQLRLCQDGEQKSFHTYRLVAEAFLGPRPFPGAIVAHRDDDKDNNAVGNLKWCTMRENYEDRDRNGKTAIGDRNGARTRPDRRPRGVRVGMSKLNDDLVLHIRLSDVPQRELAKQLGVSKTTIGHVRSRHTWRHI